MFLFQFSLLSKYGKRQIILYLGLSRGLRRVKSQTPKTLGSDNFMISLFNLYDQISCVWGKPKTPESVKRPVKKRADWGTSKHAYIEASMDFLFPRPPSFPLLVFPLPCCMSPLPVACSVFVFVRSRAIARDFWLRLSNGGVQVCARYDPNCSVPYPSPSCLGSLAD